MLKITSKLVNKSNRLMISSDKKWITNGHWQLLCSRVSCKIKENSEFPDTSAARIELEYSEKYYKVQKTALTVKYLIDKIQFQARICFLFKELEGKDPIDFVLIDETYIDLLEFGECTMSKNKNGPIQIADFGYVMPLHRDASLSHSGVEASIHALSHIFNCNEIRNCGNS